MQKNKQPVHLPKKRTDMHSALYRYLQRQLNELTKKKSETERDKIKYCLRKDMLQEHLTILRDHIAF